MNSLVNGECIIDLSSNIVTEGVGGEEKKEERSNLRTLRRSSTLSSEEAHIKTNIDKIDEIENVSKAFNPFFGKVW